MSLKLIYDMCSDSLLYDFLEEFGSANLPLPCYRDDLEIKLSSYVSLSAASQTIKAIGEGLFTNAIIPAPTLCISVEIWKAKLSMKGNPH